MLIKISGYKQHDSIELKFPDRGMVLLKGPSGSGKSTILSAIVDTLYGKERSVKPWSGGSPSEYLEIGAIRILRTRTPNSLSVDINGHEFKDAAAEAEIVKFLDMQFHEFMACSYIKQKFSNSLLDLSPADMMQFIQKLSATGLDPEVVKNEIKNKIKIRKSEYATAKATHEQAVRSLESIPEGPKEPIPVVPPFEINNFDNFLNSTATLQKDLLETTKLVTSLKHKKEEYHKTEQIIQSTENSLREKEKEIDDLLKDGNPHEKSDSLFKDFQKLRDKSEYLNKFEKILALAGRVHERFPDSAQHKGKLGSYIAEKIEILDKELYSTQKEYQKIGSELSILLDPHNRMSCPKCSTPLKFTELEGLTINNDLPEDAELHTKDLQSKYDILSEKTLSIKKDLDFLKEVNAQSIVLKQGLGIDPAPELKNRNEVTEFGNKYSEEHDANTEKLHLFINLEKEKKVLLFKLSEDKEKIEHVNIDEINEEIRSGLLKIDNLSELVSVYEEYKEKKIKYDSELREYTNHCRMLESNQKMVEDSKYKLVCAENRLAAIERSLEVVNYASAVSIENKIIEINEKAAYFVDQMFKNDGTVIQLTNFTTLSNGEERSKIGVEIIHKGQKVKNLSDFSGGEMSRACLCFQLGLSELYNSPVLMIDEGFTGLDPELQNDCLEVLKAASERKLIIVIEHGAPEHFFDEVVEI